MNQLNSFLAGLPAVAALVISCASVQAQTTAFTFQGKLTDAGIPANGDYEIQFGLADALSGGSVFATLTRDPVAVSDGVFTVELDFGAAAFIGFNRWIEISVRPSGSADPFEVLAPRQAVTSAPYAIHAGSVNASSLVGQVTDANLSTTLSFARSFTNPGNTFFGSGANLTQLNATSLNSGTLSDTRLSSNVALLDANNTFTGFNTFRNTVNYDDGTAGSRFSIRHDGASQTLRIRNAWDGVDLLSVAKNGSLGIGTTSPGSKLTVTGMVESTSGGVKFPDGSIQTRAAIGSATEYLRIGPGAFTSFSGFGLVSNSWSSGVYLAGGPATDELIAAVQLPAGARILAVTAYVNDSVVTDLRFQIDRKVNSNSSGSGTGVGFTMATSAGYINQTFTPGSPHVVNSTQAYYLRVIPTGGSWPLNGTLAVQNVVIEWDRP